MTNILMAYARPDRAFVGRLVQVLESQHWTVWWDAHDAENMDLDVFASDFSGEPHCVIAVWSKKSVRGRRLRRLARDALRRRILVSTRTDRVPLPLELRTRGVEASDLSRWQGEPNHAGLRALLTETARKLETRADFSRVPRLKLPQGGAKGRLSLNWRAALVFAAFLALVMVAWRFL